MARVRKSRKFVLLVLGLGIAVLLCGVAATVIFGFLEGREEAAQEAERETPIKPPLRVVLPARGEPVITFDAEAQRAIGLQLAVLRPAQYQDQVRAYGAVLDLTNLTTLNTNYVSAVSQLHTVQARLAASLPAFERAQALYAKNIGSLVQVQTTEAALYADKAAVAAAESQVRTLRATAMQEWGPVIGNALVIDGDLINRLIERKEFLLQITLPPGSSIDPPPTASVEVGGSSRRAEVRYISPATRTDPRIQGLSYFYAAAADTGMLPGMNARAYLATGKPVEGITIPPTAVIWWSGRAWVYERIKENTFSRREIPTDMPAELDAGFVVPAGLFPHDPQLVTTGAQLLLSEEFRSQIQVGGDTD